MPHNIVPDRLPECMELMRREFVSRKNKEQTWRSSRKEVAGCGRLQSSTTRHQRIDDPLRIDEMSAENLRVTCNAVNRRALEFAREQANEEFLYTQQWVVAEALQACRS